MARISVGGGVSDARALPGQPGYVEPAPVEELAVVQATEEPVEVTPAEPQAPAPAVAPVQDAPVAAPAAPASAAPAGKGGAA